MNEIICPHCNKAFQVDKKGYADILKQVYDKEFENKLNERLLQIEKDKTMEIHLEKKKQRENFKKLRLKKIKLLMSLNLLLKEANSVKQLAVSEAVKDIEKERQINK